MSYLRLRLASMYAALGRESVLSRWTFWLPFIVYTCVYFIDGVGFHPHGDGYYSWIYAHSLAFDGDLDFRNDYAVCGDPFNAGMDRGTGHADNPFYAGPAFFWLPPALLLRGVLTLFLGAQGVARAACHGWFTAIVFLMAPVCGALCVTIAYHTAKMLTNARYAAFSSLFFAFSSNLFPYATSVGHYSHVYLTLIVFILTYISVRILIHPPQTWDGPAFAALLVLAALHRLPAIAYAVVPLGALAAYSRRRSRIAWRELVCLGIGPVIGIALTCLLYRYLYGAYFALPQGPNYLHLSHAHPWLVLFGVQGGFFFWTPALWISVLGLALGLGSPRLRLFTVGCIVACIVEVQISAAALDWFGNWSLGARRLLPLLPFATLFGAIGLERLHAWRPFRGREMQAFAVAALLLVLVNNVPASTVIRGDRQFTQAELYGAASPLRPLFRVIDATGWDVALLPAELYFTARYQLPVRAYREAVTPRYRRNYRTLAITKNTFALQEPWAARVTTGAWSERGIHVGENPEQFVFAAEWPFLTHVRLLVGADQDTELRLSQGGWGASETAIGAVHVPAGEPRWFELAVPPGVFDSGVNQFRFRTTGGAAYLQRIELDDRTQRVPLDPPGTPTN